MKQKLSKKNQSGQMAIFVALIFQVLFLFFAMAINIGLVVHDKINLQNSADLAVYYAAQRQAEMLNVIAHTNYQIRQSWKLLNWRYYVLGTLGQQNPSWHPAYPQSEAPRIENKVWPPVAVSPVICVNHKNNWRSAGTDDNPCKAVEFKVDNIKVPKNVAPFNPINAFFAAMATRLQRSIADTCTGYAGQNWLFASLIYASYLFDQKTRKELIRGLALNLARDQKEVLDLDGDSVFEGARKTFLKNLTATNRGDYSESGQGGAEFEMFNSLKGLEPNVWLPPIDVWFTLRYQDLKGSVKNCQSIVKQVDEKPEDQAAWENLVQLTNDAGKLNELLQYSGLARNSEAGSSYRLSIGVEKNPWYLAYVGVKVKSKPRQLFFPFGEPVQFEAQAFAQPFGGRIGPWYGRRWSRGASGSEGDSMQLSPARLLANGWQNSEQIENMMPQYSKYPGDKVGLKSFLAQQSLINAHGISSHLMDYVQITNFGEGQLNDALAFSVEPNDNIRSFEIAAIAPDLFDITYYSIQPNFGQRYLERLRNNRGRYNLPATAYPRGDLGSRNDPQKPEQKFFSIKDQILNQGRVAGTTNLQALDAFWYVREREHLLTSWVHNDKYGEYFEFPDKRFGKCKKTDDDFTMKAPDGCLDGGGRAGYSVKIVSPEMLRTPLKVGGPGQSAGVIMNAPPDSF